MNRTMTLTLAALLLLVPRFVPMPCSADTNTWGQILYTQYQSSKVYYAPVDAAAVRQTPLANETVKADFKSGKWYAVFKLSEQERSITNAVGYMEVSNLFTNPLPAGPIAGRVGETPPVAISIESMTP